MADEKKLEQAKKVYATMRAALDEREWRYDSFEDDLVVRFDVSGDDIPMQFIMQADAKLQLIRLISRLPFQMGEDKRIEGAVAACAATYGMADGAFEYDLGDGTITFRLNAAFQDSRIGVGLIQYMISCACSMVDQYNELFLALNKGLIGINEFISKAQ